MIDLEGGTMDWLQWNCRNIFSWCFDFAVFSLAWVAGREGKWALTPDSVHSSWRSSGCKVTVRDCDPERNTICYGHSVCINSQTLFKKKEMSEHYTRWQWIQQLVLSHGYWIIITIKTHFTHYCFYPSKYKMVAFEQSFPDEALTGWNMQTCSGW